MSISSIPSSLNNVSVSNVEVFPNPSSGIITVSCDENLKNIEERIQKETQEQKKAD